MEPVEDEQRQRDTGDDPPGQQTEELGLDPLGDVTVGHEGVKNPERDVGEQHEGDDLPPGLGLLLGAGGADAPASLADYHACEIKCLMIMRWTMDRERLLFVVFYQLKASKYHVRVGRYLSLRGSSIN